jgi:hypothetical protein
MVSKEKSAGEEVKEVAAAVTGKWKTIPENNR